MRPFLSNSASGSMPQTFSPTTREMPEMAAPMAKALPVLAGDVGRAQGAGEDRHAHPHRVHVAVDGGGVDHREDGLVGIGLVDGLGPHGEAEDVQVRVVDRDTACRSPRSSPRTGPGRSPRGPGTTT